MATRVMLRAGSASLRWHGSRHGQPIGALLKNKTKSAQSPHY